jgi:BTB/POZ domain
MVMIADMTVIMSEIADAKDKIENTIKYWQTLLDELDRRAMEYSELWNAMKVKEEEDKKRRDSVESMMKLNLRGQVFDTTKHTLLSVENTYFTILLSSPLFELDMNGEFFIDRSSNGFDRILQYMSTGVLSTDGLNRYDEDCMYDNLVYFRIPYEPRWDYTRVSIGETNQFCFHLLLKDGRLIGTANINSMLRIVVWNMDTNRIESTIEGHIYLVSAIIELLDGRVCSCSQDKTIKVWSIDTGDCELTIMCTVIRCCRLYS